MEAIIATRSFLPNMLPADMAVLLEVRHELRHCKAVLTMFWELVAAWIQEPAPVRILAEELRHVHKGGNTGGKRCVQMLQILHTVCRRLGSHTSPMEHETLNRAASEFAVAMQRLGVIQESRQPLATTQGQPLATTQGQERVTPKKRPE
jgi:hypothetical protein